ncbi:formyltransferase family protein [Kitasatospora sp. NPDC094011]|uniref:formyltransferase family protein n=1 Tax=Kitasatospora sp. NPDC094011 TaxID=3364090 RepID=UPI0038277183
MRILVYTECDVVTCVALNRLLPALSGHTVAVAVLRLGPVDLSSGSPLRVSDWYEREEIPRRVLAPLEEGPGLPGGLLPFGRLARACGVRLLDLDPADPVGVDRVAAGFAPDVILSLRFGLIFREPTLSLPPLGILNTHSGALPEYPGLSAYAHTLLDGHSKLTCTLHRVDAGIDTGAVVASRSLPFDPDRSVLWHLPQLYSLGAEMFLDLLPQLALGRRPVAVPQDRARRRYHREMTPALAAVLEERGIRFVDTRDVDDLCAFFTGRSGNGTASRCR